MDLYNDPANRFVAGFLGAPSMNFLPASTLTPDDPREMGLRPEDIRLEGGGPIAGTVSHVEHLGGDTNVILQTQTTPLTIRLFGQHAIAPGENAQFGYDPARAYYFAQDGQRLR